MLRTQNNHRYYTRYITGYAKRNYAVMVLALLFLAGVVFGTILMRTAAAETLELLQHVVDGFLEKRTSGTITANFLSAISSSFLFIAVLFVCGFCAISQPLEVLTPFFRGLGYGFSISCLYAEHGMRGAGFVALYIMPGMLLSTIAILLCCREALRLSNVFFTLMSGSDRGTELYGIRIYLARFFAAAVLCVFSALLEAILYSGFANYVVLG